MASSQLLLLLRQIYEEMLAVRLPICQLSYPRAGNVVMRPVHVSVCLFTLRCKQYDIRILAKMEQLLPPQNDKMFMTMT